MAVGGDLARYDGAGFISIVERSKEMLVSRSFNICLAQVEALLSSCLGAGEAAVIGVPDERFGKRCVTFVAPHPSALRTPAECEAYGKPRIGNLTPKQWIFASRRPRTANGKVHTAELPSRLAGPRP
jgi:acyl-CoA synthetase (AMP-forming)/AMP-acid ligase II